MRICLISREYPPDTGWGGVGAYTFQTANALKRSGHDVQVISLEAPEKSKSALKTNEKQAGPTSNSIPVHRVSWEDALKELEILHIAAPSSHYILQSGMAIWKKFIQLHEVEPFDVVEAPEHLAAGIYNAITRIAPLVLTLHTPHSKFVSENFHSVNAEFDHLFICLLERMAIVEADLLLSPSLDLAKFVAGDTGISLEEIEIVRNPVDTKLFTPEGSVALEPLTNKVRILFVGRLEERKGLSYLIKAIPHVLAKFKEVEFVVVGNDTNTAPGGASMKAFLENELEQSGSRENVQFISHINLTDMPSYYRSADICVIPSLYDNAPYTCIEALSSGKPVIVSSFGGTKEYVINGTTGLVVAGANQLALAEALVSLCRDKELRESMGTKAREYAINFLNIEKYSLNKDSLYRIAIDRFKENSKKPIYRKHHSQSVIDSAELLCSLDHMMLTTIYKLSRDFRIKRRIKAFKEEPKNSLKRIISHALRVVDSRLPMLKLSRSQIFNNFEKELPASQLYEETLRWAKSPERNLSTTFGQFSEKV